MEIIQTHPIRSGNPEQLDAASQALYEQRHAAARELLGTDYEFAQSQGLIDMFGIDPVNGNDGFLHVLSGKTLVNNHGGAIPAGYHHEPSSPDSSQTFVDSEHLQTANSQLRKEYRQNRYEPYLAKTVIGGFEKMAKSTMFPKEYDALTVLQAIKYARDNRDRTKDVVGAEGLVMNDAAEAPMLDSTSTMPMRMVFDSSGEKIWTAFPKIIGNRMKLGKRAIASSETSTKDKATIDKLLGLK